MSVQECLGWIWVLFGKCEIDEPKCPCSDGSGFVEDNCVYCAHALENTAVRDENSAMRCKSERRGDSEGGGEPESAWAGDDQNRNRAEKSYADGLVQEHEAEKGCACQCDNRGYEDARNAIDCALNWGADGHGVLDHADNLRKGAVVSGAESADFDKSAGVEAAGNDRIADVLADRSGLAGQQGFVGLRFAVQDGSVGGNALTGFDNECCAGLERINGDAVLLASIGNAHLLRHKAVEHCYGAHSSLFCAALNQFACKDQSYECCRGVEVEMSTCQQHLSDAETVRSENAEGEEHLHADLAIP